MDSTKTTGIDALSTNEEFIDMDVDEENVVAMSDGEVKLELEAIKRWNEALIQKKTTTEGPKTLTKAPLATLKVQSAVDIKESASNRTNVKVPRPDETVKIETKTLSKTPLSTQEVHSVVVILESTLNRPNVAVSRSDNMVKLETKKPKRCRNRDGSTKNKANKSDDSLLTLLSKGNLHSRVNGSKLVDKETNRNGIRTPINVKRVRSAETTPEAVKGQPSKLSKLHDEGVYKASQEQSSYSLLNRRTLNLKVTASCRPLTGIELRTVKQFLQFQIEQALADRKDFIAIFTEPCKIGQDVVYVYCADQRCAQWVTFMLNKDLNTEKWRITRIRPKGSSSSTVYMRMDKKSFDTINSRDENKVNWILGTISINKEIHKARLKKRKQSSEMDKSEATPSSGFEDPHFKPPSVRSVEGTPVGTGLTAVLNDGHHQRQPPPQPK